MSLCILPLYLGEALKTEAERRVERQSGDRSACYLLQPIANEERWNTLCKELAQLLGIPELWHLVHFPFMVSHDHAPVHQWATNMLTVPRVPARQEIKTLWREAVAVVGAEGVGNSKCIARAIWGAWHSMRRREAHRLTESRKALERLSVQSAEACSAAQQTFLECMTVDSTLNHTEVQCAFLGYKEGYFSEDEKQLAYSFMAEFFIKRSAVEMKQARKKINVSLKNKPMVKEYVLHLLHEVCSMAWAGLRTRGEDLMRSGGYPQGMNFEQFLRRRLATQDPLWRCLLPIQFMPLAENAPDLHSPAEIGVRIVKAAARSAARSAPPDKFWPTTQGEVHAGSMLTARPYQEAIMKNELKRWGESQDTHCAERSIDKLLALCSILAKEEGQIVRVYYNFAHCDKHLPKSQRMFHDVPATAGRWNGYLKFN